MDSTKSVRKVPVDRKLLIEILLQKKLDELEEAIYDYVLDKKGDWIEIVNKGYYFIPEDSLIIINPKKIPLHREKFINLTDLNWEPMKKWIVKKYFCDEERNNPIKDENENIVYMVENGTKYSASYIYCSDIKKHVLLCDEEVEYNYDISWPGIKLPYYQLKLSDGGVFFFFLTNNFNVFKEENEFNKVFELFSFFNKNNYLVFKNGKLRININKNEFYSLFDICKEASLEKIFEEIIKEKDNISIDKSLEEKAFEYLLNCDEKRINMEKYPINILKDPESGHWELWDNGNSDLYVDISSSVIARNPIYDALENKSGVVGIDFGTKSTVVTYKQSRADVLPMRIGSGRFSRVVTKEDYENPTVMELRNVEKFISDYCKSVGRPNTCWEDLLISHEAAEQLKSEQSSGDTFASFFSDLKQWASDKNRLVKLRDLKGKELSIPSYMNLSEEDFDPIEIYAYYLGLFINNMIHKIYLRYKLSFPATVEKKVRDKILDSFTKGLKKSLPKQVIEDETCMKIFKVEQGASEPAAYAITALQGYGFEPEDEEKYYYGIFDFGGGTTDFDFGVWSSEEEELENYDYQISHFGQGGDPYLGGENLLEIMSYHVFMSNYNKLLNDKIVFIRPFGEKEVAGKDYLINQDSQYAHFNQKRMMEVLRGVWEGDEEERKKVESGTISVSLFSMDGNKHNNYSLDVDLTKLDLLIEERIEKGISQFFDALKNCFGVNRNQKDIYNVEAINIFLAGNSSKSPVVYKIFKKYIDSYNEALNKNDSEKEQWFKMYPPLGTPQSDAIINGDINPLIDEIIDFNNLKDQKVSDNKTTKKQEENAYEFDEENLHKPTGKTGVAFGLLNNRVRVVQNESEEIEFRYYIGQNRKNKFYCVIDKDNSSYNEWIKFCRASKEEFDIWFTRSATAPTNKIPINQIGVYSEIGFLDVPMPEKNVYIRLVSPTDIEYVVATEEEINNNSFEQKEIERVSLQEKK